MSNSTTIIDYNIFNILTKKKFQLLEPITTLAKLALLNFSPIGSKIFIQKNKIIIQEYNNIQFIERFINGDSRNDICILSYPISNFVSCYLSNKSSPHYYKFSFITKCAILGLKQLQTTYYNLNSRIPDNSIFTIQCYIDYLTKSLIGDLSCCETNLHVSSSMLSFTLPENLIDSDKMKQIWTDDDITNLYDLIHKCFIDFKPLHSKDINLVKYIKMIDILLNTIENHFYTKILLSNSGI